MQTSVPELMDLSKEPERRSSCTAPTSRKPGTYAANCLLARRLAERGVRFIQLYHRGWDQHGNLPRDIALQCKDTDQPTAALITDLKQRGLLDDTLVVWGGEFGRTVYQPGRADRRPTTAATTIRATSACGWPAAASSAASADRRDRRLQLQHRRRSGSRPRPERHDPALLGIDHKKLTYRFQGRDFRLTDVHGEVVEKMLA